MLISFYAYVLCVIVCLEDFCTRNLYICMMLCSNMHNCKKDIFVIVIMIEVINPLNVTCDFLILRTMFI